MSPLPWFATLTLESNRPIMRILHRYILRELFYYFFLIMAIFVTILIAKEIYDTRDEIIDEKPQLLSVVEYVFLSIPGTLSEAFPLVAMFAVLFAIGMMARHREITAMVAAGVTFNQLSIPVFVFGALVTIGSFWFSESIAPAALARARYILQVEIKGGNQFSFTSNDEIFRKGAGSRFYIMANFDDEKKVMTRPVILDRDESGEGLAQRIEAERAVYVESGEGGDHYWEFQGAQRWTFDPEGSMTTEKFAVPLRIKMEEKLDSFLNREKKAEEMHIGELREYCSILENQGNLRRLPKYQAILHGKFSLPLACLLLALVGFSVSADLHVRRFVLAFSTGLIIGVVFYLLREALLGMGERDLINPGVAAWAPVAIFGLLVAGLMYRLGTVH